MALLLKVGRGRYLLYPDFRSIRGLHRHSLGGRGLLILECLKPGSVLWNCDSSMSKRSRRVGNINKHINSGTRPNIIETPFSTLNLEQFKSHGSGGKDKGRRDRNHSNSKRDQDQPSQIRPRDRNTVHLDGSTLEGGGQLVRVALTLSAITKIPIHITKIRAGRGGGRSSGGLKESHLAALEVLGEECNAHIQGGHVGSKELLFEPATQRPRQDRQSSETHRRTIELQKPGSVWLILQALLPWYLLRPGRTELTLKGGTNVSSSMSGDYVQQVLVPVLEKLISSTVQVDIIRRGWAGNAPQIGEAKVSIEGHTRASDADAGTTWDGFRVQHRSAVSKIALTIIAHPASMRAALLARASEEISLTFPAAALEITTDEDSLDPRRLYVLLVAHTTAGWRFGRDFLGTGKKLNSQREVDGLVEGAVKGVVGALRKEVERGGCVDEFLQDQLVVFQALARGTSVVDAGKGEWTLHAKTVRWVCGEVLGGGGFVSEEGGGCVGIGARVGMGGLAGVLGGLRVDDEEANGDSDG